jgi:hypothetical protein
MPDQLLTALTAGIAQSSERRDLNQAYTTPFPKVAGASPAPRSLMSAADEKRHRDAVMLGWRADRLFRAACNRRGVDYERVCGSPIDALEAADPELHP